MPASPVSSLEISEQTFHRWRNQYGGMKSEEAKRLKELEGENKRLKKLFGDIEERTKAASSEFLFVP